MPWLGIKMNLSPQEARKTTELEPYGEFQTRCFALTAYCTGVQVLQGPGNPLLPAGCRGEGAAQGRVGGVCQFRQ
jgi:hypothetical protein